MGEQLLNIFREQLKKRNDVIKEMQISDETAKLIQEKILDQKNKNIVCQLYILLKKYLQSLDVFIVNTVIHQYLKTCLDIVNQN